MQTSALPTPSGRRLRVLTMTLLASAMLAPASAAGSGEDVLRDCVNGALKASYSVADYREALADLPADLAEYSDCESQIRTAQIKALSEARAANTPYVGHSRATSLPRAGADAAQGGVLYGEDGSTYPGDTANATTPATQSAPISDGASDAGFLQLPVAGDGDGPSASAGSGSGGANVPLVPSVIALSVIALTAARGLVAWSRRPERLIIDSGAEAT